MNKNLKNYIELIVVANKHESYENTRWSVLV